LKPLVVVPIGSPERGEHFVLAPPPVADEHLAAALLQAHHLVLHFDEAQAAARRGENVAGEVQRGMTARMSSSLGAGTPSNTQMYWNESTARFTACSGVWSPLGVGGSVRPSWFHTAC
jgi:hypothetical protein